MGKRRRRPTPRLQQATRRWDCSRGELLALALIIGWGVLLRIMFPNGMAVEHFDEGVYASNLWFSKELGYAFHLRHLYAPPLVPSLIEASLVAEQLLLRPGGRPTGWAVMAPSLLAGCATPALVWLAARTWFGPVPAMAAVVLASCSDFHALYSRTALTDVLLVFWLLCALWLAERACSSRRSFWIVAAGLATALAWWTKYNGWLPLVILLCGGVAATTCQRAARAEGRQWLLCWLGISATALVCWSPCLWWLQDQGGYAAVAANHRQYVAGLAGWPAGLLRQAANLYYFDGAVTTVGVSLAAVAASWQLYGSNNQQSAAGWTAKLPAAVALAALLAAATVWLGSAAVLLSLSLGGIFCRLAQILPRSTDQALSQGASRGVAVQTLRLCLMLAWVAGLLVATPLYHPYPRLTLPWLCGIWIAGGLGVEQLVCRWPLRRPLQVGPLLVISLILVLGASSQLARRRVPAWQPRTGLLSIARKVSQTIQPAGRPPRRAVLFVYGEPGLFYQLRAESQLAAVPIGALDAVIPFSAPGTDKYLLTGPHAHRSAQFAAQFSQAHDQFELIRSYPYFASDLVLLNQHHPGKLANDKQSLAGEIRLYRAR